MAFKSRFFAAVPLPLLLLPPPRPMPPSLSEQEVGEREAAAAVAAWDTLDEEAQGRLAALGSPALWRAMTTVKLKQRRASVLGRRRRRRRIMRRVSYR